MNKPSMLILGTGGIAQACIEKFGATYSITCVSRRAGDIKGDLTDVHFRDRLVADIQPNVIISTYGNWPKNLSLIQTLEIYFNSVVDLFEKFEKKGGLEYFVIISSIDAHFSSQPGISPSQFAYRAAKKSLSDFFKELQKYAFYNSNIILIEPGMITTDFANINQRIADKNPEDFLIKLNLDLYKPEDIVNQIAFCLKSNRSLTVTMHNKSNKSILTST